MATQTIDKNMPGVTYIYESDSEMKKLIDLIGPFSVQFRDDYFASLVHSIVAQLISREAADAVYARLEDVTTGITPEHVLACHFDTLKSAGLTKRKTEYIRGLANEILSGQLDFAALKTQSNKDVIKALTALKGIGQWTAEVFLILSFQRENVLAAGDVALQRAAQWLYGTEKEVRKETLIKEGKKWTPYQSIGCLYLWEIIHLKLIDQYDSIEAAIRAN